MADTVVDYYSLEAGRKSASEEALFRKEIRHGFIRKVYGIITAQLLLTTIVASLLLFVPGGVKWAKEFSSPVVIASTGENRWETADGHTAGVNSAAATTAAAAA
ncbi:hypothetical protein Emag_004052 [Eimeria magna]